MADVTLAAGSLSTGINRTSTFGTFGPSSAGTMLYVNNTEGDYLVVVSVNGVNHTMAVTPDIIEGASGSHDLSEGYHITRTLIVKNVPSVGDIGVFMYMAEAAVAQVTGPRGSTMPSLPVPTYLKQFSIEPLAGQKNARVKADYVGYRLPSYEFSVCLTQRSSNIDVNGTPIVVGYTYPTSYDGANAGKTKVQSGTVRRPVAEAQFTANFLVTAGTLPGSLWLSATQIASYLVGHYVNMINASQYTVGLLTGDPGQWLIDDGRAVSRDGGNTMEVSLTFHYRQEGWNETATFINPDDGLPPPDLVEGVGYKSVQVCVTGEFPTIYTGVN